MLKSLLLAASITAVTALTSSPAHAGDEMKTTCYNDTFNVHAQVSIKRKIAHSIFTGDYYILKIKIVPEGSFSVTSGSTPDRPWNGKYYFRTSDRQYMRAIIDTSVYTNGRGKVTAIRVGGKNTGVRTMTFMCGN